MPWPSSACKRGVPDSAAYLPRYGKLSAEDKALLYVARPDLDKSSGQDEEALGRADRAEETTGEQEQSQIDSAAVDIAVGGRGQGEEAEEEREEEEVKQNRGAGAGSAGIQERPQRTQQEGGGDEVCYDYLEDYRSDSSDDEKPDEEDLTLHLLYGQRQSPSPRRGVGF